MIAGLTDWVRSVVIVVAIVSFLEMLLPDGSVRKFSRFIMGLIVVITVLGPLVNLTGNMQVPDYKSAELQEVIKRGQNVSKEGQEQMWRQMQTQAENQVRGLIGLVDGVEDAEVITQVDATGNLRRVVVKVRPESYASENAVKEESILQVATVAPVHIGFDSVESLPAEEDRGELTTRVTKLLTDFYGLSAGQVSISYVDE